MNIIWRQIFTVGKLAFPGNIASVKTGQTFFELLIVVTLGDIYGADTTIKATGRHEVWIYSHVDNFFPKAAPCISPVFSDRVYCTGGSWKLPKIKTWSLNQLVYNVSVPDKTFHSHFSPMSAFMRVVVDSPHRKVIPLFFSFRLPPMGLLRKRQGFRQHKSGLQV